MPDLVFQAGEVQLRHYGTKGPGVTYLVAGVPMSAYGWDGVNGTRGFQSGSFSWKMLEAGTFQVVFPNAAGEDGVMHRDRFQILSDANYRPGDEWIEIYWEKDLLFVGTPTQVTRTRATIEITGYDAMWLLNKTRDTAAGFWHHPPRDVWQHYTQAWQTRTADTFNGFNPAWSLTQASTRGWTYAGAEGGPNGARVRVNAVNQDAYLWCGVSATSDFTVGLDTAWRAEAVFTRSLLALDPAGTDSYFRVAITAIVNGVQRNCAFITFYEDRTFITNVDTAVAGLNGFAQNVKLNTDPPGPYRVAIEGRGRWVYFYVNGNIVGCTPQVSAVGTNGAIRFELHSGSAGGNEYVDISESLMRAPRPFLFDTTSDYHIPGAPTDWGLKGYFYDDSDLADKTGTMVAPGLVFSPVREANNTIYAAKVSRNLRYAPTNATNGGGWQPTGVENDEWFSVRWVGSIYLDFAATDYRFRALGDNVRCFIGTAAASTPILEEWNLVGTSGSNYTTSNWLKQTFGYSKTGWYPIVVELQVYGQDSVPGGTRNFKLEYQASAARSTTAPWRGVGESMFSTSLMALGPAAYWQFAESDFGTTAADDVGAFPLTRRAGSSPIYNAGPHVGALAYGFDPNPFTPIGSTPTPVDYQTTAQVITSGSAFTVMAWVYPNTDPGTTTARAIFDNISTSSGMRLSQDPTAGGAWNFVMGDGTTLTTISGGIVQNQVWSHVAASWDGTNMRLLVNGAVVAGPVAKTHRALTGMSVGGWIDHSHTYHGRISEPAVFNKQISGAQIASLLNDSRNPGPVKTSPIGCFDTYNRFESHYEQLQNIIQDFGYQTWCEPRQLESGEAPGRLALRVRVGRDTNLTVDEDSTTQLQAVVNAEEVADSILADAQGLGGNDDDTMTAEEIDYGALLGHHVLLHQMYDSLGDITFDTLFHQRLQSMLALRSSGWEEVTASSPSRTDFVDSFPLSGALALFRWQPGDGVRLDLPTLAVQDPSPRQVMGVDWAFFPDGLGAPSVSFRQRPRNLREFIKRMQRQSFVQKRNYQGQIIWVSGGLASAGWTTGNASAGAVDTISRVSLPADLSSVIRAYLVVLDKENRTDRYTIWLSNSKGGWRNTGIQFRRAGRYDVTSFVDRDGTSHTKMAARIANPADAVTGNPVLASGVQYRLELKVVDR